MCATIRAGDARSHRRTSSRLRALFARTVRYPGSARFPISATDDSQLPQNHVFPWIAGEFDYVGNIPATPESAKVHLLADR